MRTLKIPNDQRAQLELLYDDMEGEYLTPLWEKLADLVQNQPRSPAITHKWSYASARKFLMRAGDLITAEQAERRVLVLENPGLPGESAIVPSLYAGLQLILPGEIAPSHRHSQSALRFVVEGEGAYTAIDGERTFMHRFDLVLTPNWQWHDHGNPSDRPMVWLDGLDIPTVRAFDASFAEQLDQQAQDELVQPGDTIMRYGENMRPMPGSTADRRPAAQPLFHYPYARWKPALASLAAASPVDPHFGHALEFLNPATGGPVMPTISAHVRLIPAGYRLRPRRTSEGQVFVVCEGSGVAFIDGEEVQLQELDVLAVPAWRELIIAAGSELVLFAFTNKASQEKLGLYREEKA